MSAYALKAPAASWKPPAWLTPHNIAVTAVVAVGLLVIVMLARAVLRLSGKPAPAPAPTPKSSGGRGKLLLLAAAAAGGWWLLKGHATAATGAKAAPAPSPSPSPSPTPTVTRTLAPHATTHISLPHFTFLDHLTGTDWVLIVLIGAVAAYVIVRPLLKRGD